MTDHAVYTDGYTDTLPTDYPTEMEFDAVDTTPTEDDAAAEAVAAVAAARAALVAGPENIADALDQLREEVRAYGSAYDALLPFGLAHGARRPATLPGTRAVEAVTRKRALRVRANTSN